MNDRMREKFGDSRVEMLQAQLKAFRRQSGINYTFPGKCSTTKDSHCIIYMGGQQGPEVQRKIVEEIFKSYFENSGDLTSWEMLADAAEKAGMDKDTVPKDLEEGKGAVEVDREIQEAYKVGIHTLPNIVINRAFNWQSASDPNENVDRLVKPRKTM